MKGSVTKPPEPAAVFAPRFSDGAGVRAQIPDGSSFRISSFSSAKRMLLLAIGLLLVAVGLAVFIIDAYTSYRLGFHLNEVAGFTQDGDPIDWPTGERPLFTMIPIFVYALSFWAAAAVAFLLRFQVGRSYRGRSWKGTE